MRGPRGVTTAMRGWCILYIGWLQDEASRAGGRGSVRRGAARRETGRIGVVVEEELRETETWPNRN